MGFRTLGTIVSMGKEKADIEALAEQLGASGLDRAECHARFIALERGEAELA